MTRIFQKQPSVTNKTIHLLDWNGITLHVLVIQINFCKSTRFLLFQVYNFPNSSIKDSIHLISLTIDSGVDLEVFCLFPLGEHSEST